MQGNTNIVKIRTISFFMIPPNTPSKLQAEYSPPDYLQALLHCRNAPFMRSGNATDSVFSRTNNAVNC